MLSIGAIGADETPTASEASYVERRYDAKLDEWRDAGLVYWPNTGRTEAEIPLVVYSALVDLMGNEIAIAFGRGDKIEDKEAREKLLLQRLRRIMAKRSSGEPTRAVYY